MPELNTEQLSKVFGGYTNEQILAKFNALLEAVAAKYDAWNVDIETTTEAERAAQIVIFINEALSTYDNETQTELTNFMIENKALIQMMIDQLAKA